MSMFKRKQHDVPELNTASLPDLIFTVLFFFMIVTHMRNIDKKVQVQLPQGTELARLTKKGDICHIFIGKDRRGAWTVQVQNRTVPAQRVAEAVAAERKQRSDEDGTQLMAAIKADRTAPMRLVTEVKQACRKAGVLKISYAATTAQNDTK